MSRKTTTKLITLSPKEYAGRRGVTVQTVSEALRDCAVPHKRLPGVTKVVKHSRFYDLHVDPEKLTTGRANKAEK